MISWKGLLRRACRALRGSGCVRGRSRQWERLRARGRLKSGAVGIRWREDDLRAGADEIGVADGGVGGEEFAPAEA